ncbi:hypothetical protein B0H19DRAFT_240331 [Mycena capillaripes]|nr:hypothetical protein B0H19DRAFT_240331 [Mycena capillaripes]
MVLMIPAAVWKAAAILLLPSFARADDACATTSSGTTICPTKLTPTILAAIISTVAVLLLLGGAFAFVFYRRRQLARANAAVAANVYVIEGSQMRGPPQFIRRTTYSATYDPAQALPRIPQSAGVKTKHDGVTYPFARVRFISACVGQCWLNEFLFFIVEAPHPFARAVRLLRRLHYYEREDGAGMSGVAMSTMESKERRCRFCLRGLPWVSGMSLYLLEFEYQRSFSSSPRTLPVKIDVYLP